MRRLRLSVAIVLVAATIACKNEGTIAVRSLEIKGANSIDVDALKAVLATRENSRLPVLNVRLPWGSQRNSFDRNRFDADLKRVEAFYADRGFPDARVTDFDVKLND